jgi:hypothetical protein
MAFVTYLTSRGYVLVEDFTLYPEATFDHCGFVFVRQVAGESGHVGQ